MTILDEAAALTSRDRQRDYGHPKLNHGCTAALWTAYLVRRAQVETVGLLLDEAEEAAVLRVLPLILSLGGRDVCWLNTLQKASRDANLRKQDNLVDCAGYMRNAEMIEEAKEWN